MLTRLKEELWVECEAATATLEEVENLTAVNLKAVNLETLVESEDLKAAQLAAANLETLKEAEDLTSTNLVL